MQITGGSITIPLNDPTVTEGSSPVDWSQVNDNNYLIIAGVVYTITARQIVTSPKTLTITPPFAGIAGAGVTNYTGYVIVRDFTENHHLPLVNPGDLEAARLVSRAFAIIDTLLTGSGGDTEIAISKTAHGFQVGNAIRYHTSNGFVRAFAGTVADATVLGIVTSVPDANSFGFKTQGKVEGLVGFTSVTPGTIYYLTATDTHPNLSTTKPSRIVPVMVLTGDTEGYIMGLATNEAGLFSTETNGIVTGPNATAVTNGYYLKAGNSGGTWDAASVASNSLTTTQHAKAATPDWYGFMFDPPTNGLSLIRHIQDLQTRLLNMETLAVTGAVTRLVYNRRNSTVGGSAQTGTFGDGYGTGYTWTYALNSLPAGVTKARVTLISGYGVRRISTDHRGGHRFGYVHPMIYTCDLQFPALSTLNIEIGYARLTNAITLFSSDRFFARLKVGATEVANVHPTLSLCAFYNYDGTFGVVSHSGQRLTTSESEAPVHIYGPLFTASEISSATDFDNEWLFRNIRREVHMVSGVVTIEYGGYIQQSF